MGSVTFLNMFVPLFMPVGLKVSGRYTSEEHPSNALVKFVTADKTVPSLSPVSDRQFKNVLLKIVADLKIIGGGSADNNQQFANVFV